MTSDGGKQTATQRVTFSRGISVRIVAVDGSWSQPCLMLDAGQQGAKLQFEAKLQNPDIKEFFLLLSANGTVARRCERSWINGNEMGVKFLESVTLSARPADDGSHHEI